MAGRVGKPSYEGSPECGHYEQFNEGSAMAPSTKQPRNNDDGDADGQKKGGTKTLLWFLVGGVLALGCCVRTNTTKYG